MKAEKRSVRREQIETAAYDLLRERGYAGTSMLAIAKRARASNETLYNWYGDKVGLIRALVARNAEEVRTFLQSDLDKDDNDALETLRNLGPMLLSLLTSEKAVALNRAAAADPSGELGAALSETGRETIVPLIRQALENARKARAITFSDADDAIELYLGLLVGDLQIRRAIGRMPAPDPDTVLRRSEAAFHRFRQLLSPPQD